MGEHFSCFFVPKQCESDRKTRTVPRGTPGSFSWKDQLDNDSIERNNERSQFKASVSISLSLQNKLHIRPWLSSGSRVSTETLTAFSSTSSNSHSQTKPENSDIDWHTPHFWSEMLPVCHICIYHKLPSFELPVGDYLKIVRQLKLRSQWTLYYKLHIGLQKSKPPKIQGVPARRKTLFWTFLSLEMMDICLFANIWLIYFVLLNPTMKYEQNFTQILVLFCFQR